MKELDKFWIEKLEQHFGNTLQTKPTSDNISVNKI